MRDFGFTFNERAATQGADEALSNQVMDFGIYGNKRRYGVADAKIAAKYGYHLISAVVGSKPQRDVNDRHGFGEMAAAKTEVLYGQSADGHQPTQPVNGKRVPAGGCLGVAANRLADMGDPGQHGLASTIKRDSFARAENDAAVRAVFAKWSSCMKTKGYTSMKPGDGPGFALEIESKAVSSKEIAAAVADVECKKQSDVIGIWAGFEVRYQNEQIEQHAEELAAIKAGNEKMIKGIASIVGS